MSIIEIVLAPRDILKAIRIIGSGLCLVLFLSTCRTECHDATDINCENYDPCYGRKEINTNFRVRPGDNGFKPPEAWCDLVSCDTFNASSVRFDIPLNNPSYSTYEWQIGTEPTPRKGKAVEVDFSDYLNAGNWEKHITVTLSIRTRYNSCMASVEDTLVKVSRDLFFTQKRYHIYNTDSAYSLFEGYLLDKPNEIFRVRTDFNNNKYYKDFQTNGYNALLIGFPFADTILMPWSIFIDECHNFKQEKIISISYQNPSEFEKLQKYSHGLMEQDYYYLGDNNYLMRLKFYKAGFVAVYNFRCKKIQ